jgi:hypothetical protein
MSRSTRIFRLIARDLPGVVLCKDMLVVVPTERILRGFLLETTTERDRVYLWKVVTPLYRPMRHVILDYSDRIPETGDDVYIDGLPMKNPRQPFAPSSLASGTWIICGQSVILRISCDMRVGSKTVPRCCRDSTIP